jgi:hypothetical protein
VTDLVVDAQVLEASPPPPPCVPSDAGVRLAQKPCVKNDDCVLTDTAFDCNACNVAELYPASKRAASERESRCAKEPSCPPRVCPPKDTYTPAFYRAECRQGVCIAFRWHGGG